MYQWFQTFLSYDSVQTPNLKMHIPSQTDKGWAALIAERMKGRAFKRPMIKFLLVSTI